MVKFKASLKAYFGYRQYGGIFSKKETGVGAGKGGRMEFWLNKHFKILLM